MQLCGKTYNIPGPTSVRYRTDKRSSQAEVDPSHLLYN